MSTFASWRGGRNLEAAKGFAFLLVTAFSWGLNWPVIKFMLSELPPFSARVAAGMVGTALAFGLAASRGERLAPPPGHWGKLTVSAVLNFSSFMLSSSLALLWLRASEAVIIGYTLPIWASLLAWPILGERPTPRRLLALVLGLGGVVVTMSGQPVEASWAKLPGILCAFAGSVMFALGLVVSKRHPLAMPPVAGVAWQVGIGSSPAILPAIFEHPHWEAVTPGGWACLLYMSTMPIVIAYITWFRALRLLPASTAAIATFMVPVIGVCSAALMLGEPLGVRELAGLGLTLSGVGLAARR